VLLLDRVEREALALIAAGATVDGKPLTLAAARAQFESDLLAEPEQIDPERLELMRALGLAA
jgi:hypothetical protein